MRETDRQKDAETEIKSKALKSWAQSSYPGYPEWSLTGYSLTQNMSQVFWPKFHGLSGFLMLNRNLKFIPSWNSIDSRPAWELGTGRHLWIGVTSPYLPILLIWILHLPCPFQLDMFPPYSQDSRWPCKSRLPGAPRPEAASVQWLGTGYFWWRPKLYQTFPVFHPKMLFWEAHWQRTHSWRKVSPFFMFYNLQMKNKKSVSMKYLSFLTGIHEHDHTHTHTHRHTLRHSSCPLWDEIYKLKMWVSRKLDSNTGSSTTLLGDLGKISSLSGPRHSLSTSIYEPEKIQEVTALPTWSFI